MGFKATQSDIDEWERKGLIAPSGPAPAARPTEEKPSAGPRLIKPLTVITCRVPLIVSSEANIGGQLRAKIARKEAAKGAVKAFLPKLAAPLTGPFRVRLTRLGSRRLDDDNEKSAFKAVRDAVAEWLGVDDGDRESVRWEYRQRASWEAGIIIRVKGN